MEGHKFNPEKLEKLNNPERLEEIPPDFVWNILNMRKADTVVEIGAGTAFFSIAFGRQAESSRIYACDISETMISWIKEHIVPRFPRIIPVKTEEHSIPLEDAIADLVFMICLHHELDSPVLTLKEAYRVLKPGGKIFIVDWKKENMTEGPPLQIRFFPEQVKKQMMNCGFKSLKIFNELSKHFLLTGEK